MKVAKNGSQIQISVRIQIAHLCIIIMVFSIFQLLILCFAISSIFLMTLSQKYSHPIRSELAKQSQSKIYFFEPQIEHQHYFHSEDRDLSPWTKMTPKQKTTHHEYSPQEIQYHKFLANVRLSTKNIKGKKEVINPENNMNLENMKAELSNKINAEKIELNSNDMQIFEESQGKQQQETQKLFLKKKLSLQKNSRRPKSIQLRDYAPQNCVDLSDFFSMDTIESMGSPEKQTKNKSLYLHHKAKKLNEINKEDKNLTQAIKNFRINILNVQKKVSETLQMTKSLTLKKQKRPRDRLLQSTEAKNCGYKIYSNIKILKIEKKMKESTDQFACLGNKVKVKVNFKNRDKNNYNNWFQKH